MRTLKLSVILLSLFGLVIIPPPMAAQQSVTDQTSCSSPIECSYCIRGCSYNSCTKIVNCSSTSPPPPPPSSEPPAPTPRPSFAPTSPPSPSSVPPQKSTSSPPPPFVPRSNSTSSPPQPSLPTWIITLVSCVVGVTAICSCLFVVWRMKNPKEGNRTDQVTGLLPRGGANMGDGNYNENKDIAEPVEVNGFCSFPLDDIAKATENFSKENILGRGAFGSVYKGTLGGREVAVKRLAAYRSSGLGPKQFISEVSTSIVNLQHENLVRIMGCCKEKDEILIIYEFLPNKSLDLFLYDPSRSKQLNWEKRHNIINGVAKGLLHLHKDASFKIIHRDLKPSNILLDKEMNPKISDFGMAKIFYRDQFETPPSIIPGTPGYAAPECVHGAYNEKTDVFSFGVIVLEIISGKSSFETYRVDPREYLLTRAWNLWIKNQGLELMDRLLMESVVEAEVLKCIHIGLLCVQYNPNERPDMQSVNKMLASNDIPPQKPSQPHHIVGLTDICKWH